MDMKIRNILDNKKSLLQYEEGILGWVDYLIVSSSYGNRTRVFAVRGRRLDRLTNEPYCKYISRMFRKSKSFFVFYRNFLQSNLESVIIHKTNIEH